MGSPTGGDDVGLTRHLAVLGGPDDCHRR